MRLYVIFALIVMASCQRNSMPSISSYKQQQTQPKVRNENPDYGDLFYWAAHPQKKDPSDSVPKALQNEKQEILADVFFLHPTTLTSKRQAHIRNASLLDDSINLKTDYSSILYQATAFNKYAQVYAPRYRQAHINNYYVADRATTQQYFEIAYQDVKKAFEYYLQHHNNGKPIIIASHSQGTEHAARLLLEYFENKPLQKQLVAAYLIGMPIRENVFTVIPACETPEQVGCVCSWRTMKSYHETRYMQKETFKSIVTNPLTFTRATGFVARSNNKGSILQNFNVIVPKVTGAEVSSKALFTPKLHFKGSIFFRTKNYHVGDINLFYMNIRENAGERLKSFLKEK
jgi:hypothetical protein